MNLKDDMKENQEEDYALYTEKVVKNKKKIYKKIVDYFHFILATVLFGLIASLILVLIFPKIELSLEKHTERIELKLNENTKLENQNKQASGKELYINDGGSEVLTFSEIESRAKNSVYRTTSDTDNFVLPAIALAKTDSEIIMLTSSKIVGDSGKCKVHFETSSGIRVVPAELILTDQQSGLSLIDISKKTDPSLDFAEVETVSLGNSYLLSENSYVVIAGRIGNEVSKIETVNVYETSNISLVDMTCDVYELSAKASNTDFAFLFDRYGNVSGIVRHSDKSENLQALGISDFKYLIGKMSTGHKIKYLGIKGASVTVELNEMYKMPDGVYVSGVELNSPAYIAGIQVGDVITGFGGEEVLTIQQFSEKLYNCIDGQNVNIQVKRPSKDEYREITLQAKIGTR